ncbi:MAG: hypothetical protein HOP14_13755 [Acidobacteria bacterium]|nr:hypothetical protein [Acidobacteriota bacterium]
MVKGYCRLGSVLAVAALLGIAAPARAQMDLAGDWQALMHEDQLERIPGPELGEFFGVPINEAARARAELWDAAIQTLPEWQCRPHGADYITRGPSPPRIWKEVDPSSRQITAFHAEWLRSIERPFYMDGRDRPSQNAAHTWGGFATAHWVGDVLKVSTTHLKEDYVRRNGLPRSDKATLTEFLIRNGDYLTWVTITHDPVYLDAPFIRTTDHFLNRAQQVPPYPCEVVAEIDRPRGVVPHHFPGENPQLQEAAARWGVPFEATQGGPATMYPEYQETLRRLMGGSN